MASPNNDYIVTKLHFKLFGNTADNRTKGKVIIFLSPHLLLIFLGMIVITYEMKNPMNNNPVEFIFKLGSIIRSIVPYRIYADEQISGQYIFLTVIEGYDISEVVVLEILHVDIKYVIVGAKNDADITKAAYFALSNESKPFIVKQFMLEFKLDILAIITYHSGIFFACKFTTNNKKLEFKFIIYTFEDEYGIKTFNRYGS